MSVFALVMLGRCDVRTAEKLASVLRGERPPVGAYAVDVRDGRVGEVMGHVAGNVQLRPVAGSGTVRRSRRDPPGRRRYCGRGSGTEKPACPEPLP